jgi:hypothetical protein
LVKYTSRQVNRETSLSASPESEGEEVEGESEDGEGGGLEDEPVGFESEGDVAELENLIEGEGQCEKSRGDEVERDVDGGHGEEEDVRKKDEDVMKRHDTFPTEAGEESEAFVFLVLLEGLEVLDNEIGEGEESDGDSGDEDGMCLFTLECEGEGWNDVAELDGKDDFTEATVEEA